MEILNNNGEGDTLKTKSFLYASGKPEDFDKKIIEWLAQFPNIRIKNISYSSEHDCTICTIWYFLN
jgi:hypothetical protein